MTRTVVATLALALTLTGCATGLSTSLHRLETFTAADLRAAAAEGRAARAAGALPPSDRWPECFDVVAAKLDAVAQRASEPPMGAAVLVMRAHVAKHRAQVILDLERDAIRLGVSLVPGGDLLKLVR